MWRSNALCLRSCSSIPIHNGLKKRWYSGAKALPVSEDEFMQALDNVHSLLKRNNNRRRQRTLGLAVSGGVDSMALAELYSKAALADSSLPKCHGFIVDHKVRKESTEEAEWVADQLRRKFGMETSIIPLTWPANYDPFDFRRFETDARRLRYQALGQACKKHDIDQLMVAHHGDDQAETVMMRLVNMRFRSGLQGMQGAEWIPECYGKYGIYHSGNVEPEKYIKMGSGQATLPFRVEKGGIQILRPLLGFEKKRLIATCEDSGTAWAEDQTNQIQTLTARNAIRHVFKNCKLPEALSIESLVKVSERMQARVEAHKAYAQNVFNNMPLKLDIQTGSVVTRLPPVSSFLDRPIESDSDKREARNNAYFVMERLAEYVSPRERAPLSQLANAVLRIYPMLATEDEGPSESVELTQTAPFCVFGAWWRKWDLFSPFDDVPPQLSHPMDWLLSRQPPEDNEAARQETHLVFPPTTSVPLSSYHNADQADWQLFDGRFWIRLKNHTSQEIVLRALNDTELRSLSVGKPSKSAAKGSTTPEHESQRSMKAALNLINPTSLRRHLPALFLRSPPTPSKSDGGSAKYTETLIALPTLNVTATPSSSYRQPVPPHCTFEIRYKKINPGRRKLSEIVIPGIRKEDVVEEERRLRLAESQLQRSKRRVSAGQDIDEYQNDEYARYRRAMKEKRQEMEMERGRTRHRDSGKTRVRREDNTLEPQPRSRRTSEIDREGLEFLESRGIPQSRESYKLFEEPRAVKRAGISSRDLAGRI